MPTNDGNIVKRTSQYIDNLGFDEVTGLPMVLIAGFDGQTVTRENVSGTFRADVSSSSIIYIGEAPLGAAETDATWTITKYDLSTPAGYTGLKTRSGAGVWTDRATETYL